MRTCVLFVQSVLRPLKKNYGSGYVIWYFVLFIISLFWWAVISDRRYTSPCTGYTLPSSYLFGGLSFLPPSFFFLEKLLCWHVWLLAEHCESLLWCLQLYFFSKTTTVWRYFFSKKTTLWHVWLSDGMNEWMWRNESTEQKWTDMNGCEQKWTYVSRCEQMWTDVNRCE